MEPIISFTANNRFLSNFFVLKVPVEFEGMEFATTENAYVAAKTTDLKLRLEIKAMKPGEAKRFGKRIFKENLSTNPKWSDKFRLELMEDLVFQKFLKNGELQSLLLATGLSPLIEGNMHHDNFFGICKCGNCPEDARKYTGLNILVKILMDARERLRTRNDL